MNTYPVVSSTFISREIKGLEDLGYTIDRYVIRRWQGSLVDSNDSDEARRSSYILELGYLRLGGYLLGEALMNPRRFLRALGLTFKLFRAGGGPIRHLAYLVEASALKRMLRRNPVTHIHAHYSTNTASVAMLSKALGGPEYSFTVHGPDELFNPESNSIGLKIKLSKFVFCISYFCRSQCMIFSEPAHWDRLKVVRCGLDDESLLLPAELQGDMKSDKEVTPEIRVLFVARQTKLKGGHVLLAALHRIISITTKIRLDIIGDGEVREDLELLAQELGLEPYVNFLGFQSRQDVKAAMARCDIFVLPSFAEGVPIVLMEAMAMTKPVIATQIAGIPELIDDGSTGLIVRPGDIDTLTSALHLLIRDPELRKSMGKRARQKVLEEFTIKKQAKEISKYLGEN